MNIASLDRPEEKVKGLPRICAESIGRDINDIYRGANQGDVRAANHCLWMGWLVGWMDLICLCMYMVYAPPPPNTPIPHHHLIPTPQSPHILHHSSRTWT